MLKDKFSFGWVAKPTGRKAGGYKPGTAGGHLGDHEGTLGLRVKPIYRNAQFKGKNQIPKNILWPLGPVMLEATPGFFPLKFPFSAQASFELGL